MRYGGRDLQASVMLGNQESKSGVIWMKLANKVALITGAGSGMAPEAAELFASEGAHVAVADVNEAGAKDTAAAITKAGGKAIALKADVSNSEQVQAMVAATVDQLGGLNI